MTRKDILIIPNLAAFEKLINKDSKPYDINMMVMPGTLENKHKDVDPEKGIPALRRQFHLVYIFLDGVHDVHLGADYRWLQPNDLVIVPENFLYASSNVRNCRGYCMHFKSEFIKPLLQGPLTQAFPFFNSDTEHIINVTEEQSAVLQQSFKDIINEYERFSVEKDYLLRYYIFILLLRIREIYRPYSRKLKQSATRAQRIAVEFRQLVEKHFLTIREVKQYAAMLHITPKHLSEVVRDDTGKSPRDIINDMLLLEAKVLLGSTGKTVTEIAAELNFQDQSHFNHFIKQHTSCTPLQLRKKL